MAQFSNEISLLKFEQELSSINKHILSRSNYNFDLGNFIDTDLNISTRNIVGIKNIATIPLAKSYIDNDLRTQIVSVIKRYDTIPPDKLREIINNLLKRNVLYIGSECERSGFLGIEAEYQDLLRLFKSEYMELRRVESPTIKSLMADWEKYKPSVIFISCHGLPYSLYLQDEQGNCKDVNNTDLVDFFKKRSLYTECVILSACESLTLGQLIMEACRNVICINRRVDIDTARTFCNVLMEYLNDHTLDDNGVYEKAFRFSKDYVKYEGLRDAFAFEFLKADLFGI